MESEAERKMIATVAKVTNDSQMSKTLCQMVPPLRRQGTVAWWVISSKESPTSRIDEERECTTHEARADQVNCLSRRQITLVRARYDREDGAVGNRAVNKQVYL